MQGVLNIIAFFIALTGVVGLTWLIYRFLMKTIGKYIGDVGVGCIVMFVLLILVVTIPFLVGKLFGAF